MYKSYLYCIFINVIIPPSLVTLSLYNPFQWLIKKPTPVSERPLGWRHWRISARLIAISLSSASWQPWGLGEVEKSANITAAVAASTLSETAATVFRYTIKIELIS